MNELVLDSSVVLKWFKPENETDVEAARALESQYAHGELLVTVPPLLFIELLNVAARRWSWTGTDLEALAEAIGDLGFRVIQPPLVRIAHWASVGLTAYDACYVALAEERRVRLITADERILTVAKHLAQPLGAQP